MFGFILDDPKSCWNIS